MKLKHHFKFNISDAKQLGIALISSYGMWAATGFQKSITGLMYPIMGFVTGGLASHHSTSSPNILPENHIETPYVNNINDGNKGSPMTNTEIKTYAPEVADVKKVIKINSNIIKNIS